MPTVCAIFTHFSAKANTLACLRHLAAQTRRPEHILIINNSDEDDLTDEPAPIFPPGVLHTLKTGQNLGNAGGCAVGLDYAFGKLGVDFVWVLDDDSWPRPAALEKLLDCPAEADTVRMSLVIDPAKGDELSWPLTIYAPEGSRHAWRNALSTVELPEGELIPSRGGWLGALYPRAAWERAGVPTGALFIRGEDEEYPWKVRSAGFRFVTVRSSELMHPSSRLPLLHYTCSGYSFFYEQGMGVSRQYYKVRNWAWLQRLKHPRGYLRRFASCMLYAALSLGFMMRTGELTPLRFYTLFRALHNGFYGKLRPY